MKKLLLSLSVATLFLSVSSANASNIAFIETDAIIEKSIAMKKAKKQILEQRKNYQEELSAEEEDLKKKIKKLEDQRSKFTKDTLAKKEKKLSQEITELNQLLKTRNETLREVEIKVMTQIGEKMEEILKDVKEKEKIDLIFADKQVILYNKEMDISNKVLKRLNTELPTVKVRF